MRIFYCFEDEASKFVTEIVDAWFYTLDKDLKETRFCFQDITNAIYKSELMPYGYALMCLETLAEHGYLNLENHIFTMEDE